MASVLSEDGQEVDEEQKKKFEVEGFKIMELPCVDNAVHTSFPYKSTFSIFIAVHKVYPKLRDYIQVCIYNFFFLTQNVWLYALVVLCHFT